MSTINIPQPGGRPSLLLQVLAAILGGLVLFIVAIGAISSGFQMVFADRVFPGVMMAGVDLSSLTPEQASAALNQHLTYP